MNNPELWQKIMDETLLPKWAKAEEIAEWAYFVTVINKSMTAQDILIDNGKQSEMTLYLYVESEQNDVAVFHHIVLALGTHLALFARAHEPAAI